MPAGRPSKLTPVIKKALLENIRLGLPISVAAVSAGISETTYYRWMEMARDETREDQKEYVDFREELRQAEADAQKLLVAKLQLSDHPGSMQFILERRWVKDWGRKEHLTLAGDKDQPLEHNHKLSDSAKKTIEDAILQDTGNSSAE